MDELLLAGEMQESSKKNVLRVISAQDSIEDTEVSDTRCCLSIELFAEGCTPFFCGVSTIFSTDTYPLHQVDEEVTKIM